jgi:phosphate starvation-inducible PhoH-like protein
MAEQLINTERMEHTLALFGSFDSNIRLIEEECGVSIVLRGTDIKISGDPEGVARAARIVDSLIQLVNTGETLNEQSIRYVMDLVKDGMEDEVSRLSSDVICITAKGRPLKAKTLGQKKYLDAMNANTITFGVGPAGTGKTYLAVAVAVRAFRAHEINRIILTRPAVEAGEKLGFLPGDLQNKVDPYLRPLYDALFDMLGAENYQRYVERGNIEVAPLAYMRGRTLDDSFIILDEAQNTTPEQMKMLLTRLGQNSKAVITGDVTQIDLQDKQSGLVEAIHILKNIDGIETVRLTEKDVVRHHLIQKIIKAYETYYDSKNKSASQDHGKRSAQKWHP